MGGTNQKCFQLFFKTPIQRRHAPDAQSVSITANTQRVAHQRERLLPLFLFRRRNRNRGSRRSKSGSGTPSSRERMAGSRSGGQPKSDSRSSRYSSKRGSALHWAHQTRHPPLFPVHRHRALPEHPASRRRFCSAHRSLQGRCRALGDRALVCAPVSDS